MWDNENIQTHNTLKTGESNSFIYPRRRIERVCLLIAGQCWMLSWMCWSEKAETDCSDILVTWFLNTIFIHHMKRKYTA